MPSANDLLRNLPAVDGLLNTATELIDNYGREATTDACRTVLDSLRQRILSGETPAIDSDSVLAETAAHLQHRFAPTLRPVINATGVIIHTNLGRSPLAQSAQRAMQEMSAYNTLEFDLETGKRGSRLLHASDLLAQITGAEAAMVVNNNAAANVLVLAALALGREVIVSRGQLVEIGGGFRVPDIMAQSGATLVEVGTTNRTRAIDYERAITENTALLMRVHSSNFKLVGFTEEAALEDLATIAHQHKLLLTDDLGSGALLDTAPYGLDHEPTVQESLSAGCDLVMFSGDKLLGGPQAGIIVGKKAIIDQLKKHPLARAIRADKTALAALTATLDHYRKGDPLMQIPLWQMISRPVADIRQIAQRWADALGDTASLFDGAASVIDGESTVGGGSLPGATLPTALLSLDVAHPDQFLASLRAANPPIIARIMENCVLLDPRTVLPGQESLVMETLRRSMG
jgi:L-seryl-tRNA(Ser) seleniumtransferase